MRDIAERGYQSSVPPVHYKRYQEANVAFFPGYPLLSSAVAKALGETDETDQNAYKYPMLVAAEVSAWVFWSYIALYFIRWDTPVWLAVVGIALIAAHPAAFFLVTAYSEPLFLAALMGYLYWSEHGNGGVRCWVFTAVHGVVMTATRIVGVPCVLAGLVWNCIESGAAKSRRVWMYSIAVSVVSLLGALSFFLFCQFRFHAWDLYMQTQKAGWGVEADYLAASQWETYSHFTTEWDVPINISQLSVALTPWIAASILLLECMFGRATWRKRAPFYFCAGMIFYISVAGVASVQLESMIRYQFCTHILLVMAIVHLLTMLQLQRNNAVAAIAGGAALVVSLLAYIQVYYIGKFTFGDWFA